MLNKLAVKAKDNSGVIFSVLAVVGLVGTCILTAKAAVKAEKLIDPDLDKKEKIKVYAKTYAPAVGCGVATAACILGANHVHLKKEAALAGVAALWKGNLNDLEKKVIEKDGGEKLKEMKDEIVKEKIKEKPISEEPTNAHGQILVYEPYTDQYIWTSREKIAWAMLKANEKLAKDYDVRLNLIIKMLGGQPTREGGLIGWNWENECQNYTWSYYGGPWISINPSMTKMGGHDALMLFYEVDPDTQEPDQMIYSER